MISKKIDIEIKECEGTEVYLLKNFLSKKQCEDIITLFTYIKENQCVVEIEHLAKKIWNHIGDNIGQMIFNDKRRNKYFKVTGVSNKITVTKVYSPLSKHRDLKSEGEVYKMYFYLNKISSGGGTSFYAHGEKALEIENEPGSGVLFDIDLEHESQRFPNQERKYVIGVRPIIQYLP